MTEDAATGSVKTPPCARRVCTAMLNRCGEEKGDGENQEHIDRPSVRRHLLMSGLGGISLCVRGRESRETESLCYGFWSSTLATQLLENHNPYSNRSDATGSHFPLVGFVDFSHCLCCFDAESCWTSLNGDGLVRL